MTVRLGATGLLHVICRPDSQKNQSFRLGRELPEFIKAKEMLCAAHSMISITNSEPDGAECRRHPIQSPTAALFVFLAAAAGAGVVAADFRASADGLGFFRHRCHGFADDVAGLGLRAA